MIYFQTRKQICATRILMIFEVVLIPQNVESSISGVVAKRHGVE